jgi:DNA segregation ATPase FtsK/SpoIIIE, S-DNA-T family
MDSSLLFDRQRGWLANLLALVKERSETEARVEAQYRDAQTAAERDVQAARQVLANRRDRELANAESAMERAKLAATDRFLADSQLNDEELAKARLRLAEEMDDTEQKLREALQEKVWTTTSFFDAGEKDSRQEMQKHHSRANEGTSRAVAYWQEAEQWLLERGLSGDEIAPRKSATVTSDDVNESFQIMQSALAVADQQLEKMKGLLLPKLLPMAASATLYVVLTVLGCLPALWMKPPVAYLLGGLFAGAALFVLVRSAVKFIGNRQMLRRGEQMARALDKAEVAAKRLREQAQADHDKKMAQLTERHQRDLRAAQSHFQPRIDAIVERRAYLLGELADKHKENTQRNIKRRDDDQHDADERNWAARAEADERHDRDLASTNASHQDRAREIQKTYEDARNRLQERWQSGIQALRGEHADLREINELLFPAWDSPSWHDRPEVREVPPGMRLGEQNFDLAGVPNGVPVDPRLKLDQPLQGQLPAFLPFPVKSGVLLKARDQGRAKAVQVLQAIMLRFLTALPPGKVRFTIVDPVGLGDNFASFMHLADYDELLVTSRIWTEPLQIDQRLADITGHMENVIQKYLRHQFKTIEDYNAAAGEVAEPYRVLVVANFPTNFTAEAARRLVSIVSSGAGCGVFALISVDARAPLPHGFNLSDLEHQCFNLLWKNERFGFKDDVLSQFELALDSPPEASITSRLVNVIGAQAKNASRVEVPFDFVSPKPDKVWTDDSRKGIVVPIGRSGATKRQSLALGRGTAQHALIAGKTGSGKSTLLHAIITNLALTYGPDEVEMYLIDFKKGVEFKPYAEHRLPHARVVAIESEREFGLSVLQRLDAELKARGDKFRTAGVTDIAAFRDENPKEKLPRILLVVDEFQEFFVEEDKMAQEAALLLDRLVRQGRAFGLHVVLGSQTLGGAYSLARATIDQMAVRIALQCSEADAHLILSKDNGAARLLSRPGEAIYNDQNGLLEGNDVFQVVWLPDERRERILEQLDKRAGKVKRVPPLVFEGNVPAEIGKNHLLDELLRADSWPVAPRAFSAWLGDAVAIKDPTSATFRPQSGNHLLMIGQHEEAALAILCASILGLAAQHRPDDPNQPFAAHFHVLDSTTADDVNGEFLARLVDGLPHPAQAVDPWSVAPTIAELAELVNQRHARTTEDRSTRYLIIQGLQRFRDLRKPDDEYTFGRGATVTPAQNFTTILRDGPSVGVHCLMWCDTLINVNRAMDRALLRECTQRVLFQMSATDSSHLIDTPLASRLGRNRALFHREEQDQPEKFRPYGLPSADWIKWAKKQLKRKK